MNTRYVNKLLKEKCLDTQFAYQGTQLVGMTRLELATPRPPRRVRYQTALHPDATVSILSKKSYCQAFCENIFNLLLYFHKTKQTAEN